MEKNFIEMPDLIPAKNDTPYKRILAIGDVHASFDKLISLWKKISVTAEDLLIFLGDYVQVGSKNLMTLNWLMEQNNFENIIILQGNMDEDFISYLQRIRTSTLEEAMLIHKICDFIKNMPLYHEIKIDGREYFFCHAGINPQKPLENQIARDLIWGNNLFYREYEGAAVIVVGHKSPRKVFKNHLPQYPQLDTLKPARVPNKNILLLDTRAKDEDGFLSCVDILTGEFWQS